YLAEKRIPLELCPISNLKTGVIGSLKEHPMRRFLDLGIPISLNTDDPLFFGNSLVDELDAARQVHSFTRDEIRRLMLSAVESTWLPADRKESLAARFQNDPGWNRTQ